MTDVTAAIDLLEDIASPRGARESYKAVLGRVTKFVNDIGLKLSIIDPARLIAPERLDDIWRREAKYVRAYEMDSLRAARDAKLLGEARDARRSALDRIAALEALLRVSDPEFHSDTLDQLGRDARGIRGALDQRGLISGASHEGRR